MELIIFQFYILTFVIGFNNIVKLANQKQKCLYNIGTPLAMKKHNKALC